MATRRRIGISAASTEAARRQLMQPVPCWERVLVTPEAAAPGSTLKVWKWVKTDKIQHFSDDEGGVDDPLAPLPDEPEMVEGDEEMELEENPNTSTKPASAVDGIVIQEEPPSKAASPKPQLSMSLQGADDGTSGADGDGLDVSLNPLTDADMGDVGEVREKTNADGGVELDISALGPDGLGLEGAHDLSQLDASDALVGGPLLDETGDPFGPTAP